MSEVIPIGGWVNFSAGVGAGGSDKKTVSLDFRSPEVGISADYMGQVNFDLGQMGFGHPVNFIPRQDKGSADSGNEIGRPVGN